MPSTATGIPPENRLQVCDVRRLGCLPRHESAGFNNSPRLNSFFSTWGVNASTVLRTRLGLGFSGGHWGVQAPLVIPAGGGGDIIGVGYAGNNQGTTEYGVTPITGTKIVKEGAYVAGEPVFDVTRGGVGLHNLFIQGRSGLTRAAILADAANFADFGVLVRGGDGTGKLRSSGLQIGACKVGMQFAETSAQNHADEHCLHPLYFNHCSVAGIRSKSIQVVNVNLGLVVCYGTPIGIDLQLGGQWNIGQLYYGKGDFLEDCALQVGSVGAYSQEADKVNLAGINLDGSATNTQAIRVVGDGTGTINCMMLHVPVGSTAPLLITVRSNWIVNIFGGGYLREQCVKFVDDGSGLHGRLNLYNVVMKSGHDPASLVANVAQGTGFISQRNTSNYSGEFYGGWPWYNVDQKWVNGALAAARTPAFV